MITNHVKSLLVYPQILLVCRSLPKAEQHRQQDLLSKYLSKVCAFPASAHTSRCRETEECQLMHSSLYACHISDRNCVKWPHVLVSNAAHCAGSTPTNRQLAIHCQGRPWKYSREAGQLGTPRGDSGLCPQTHIPGTASPLPRLLHTSRGRAL